MVCGVPATILVTSSGCAWVGDWAALGCGAQALAINEHNARAKITLYMKLDISFLLIY
jgi:hypothetical protein